MTGCVERETLVDARGLRPRLYQQVHHRGARQVEHALVRRLAPTLRHPFQRLGRERQINRFFGLLHGDRQTVLAVVDEHVLPLQADDVAHAQPAEAGEQISPFHGLVFHRGGDQCPHLLDGHVRPLALRQPYFVRVVELGEGVALDKLRTHGGVQRPVQHPVVGMQREVGHTPSLGAVFRQQVVDVLLTERLVDLVKRHTLPGEILQYADGHLDLLPVLLAALLLVLPVGPHPVQQENLLAGLDARLAVGQFDDAFRLDGVGGVHRRRVLMSGVIVDFRDDVHLQVLVCPLAVAVDVQIQAPAAVAQRLHPKAYRLFDFRRLLDSCHRYKCFLVGCLPQN